MYLNTTEIKTDSLYRDVVSAWGETKYIGNVASNGPSVPLPHEGWAWKNWSFCTETCLSATQVSTNSSWTTLRLNLGLCSENSVINHLNLLSIQCFLSASLSLQFTGKKKKTDTKTECLISHGYCLNICDENFSVVNGLSENWQNDRQWVNITLSWHTWTYLGKTESNRPCSTTNINDCCILGRAWQLSHWLIKNFCGRSVNLEEGLWWHPKLQAQQCFINMGLSHKMLQRRQFLASLPAII